MRRICSIVTALVMALTIFVIPNMGAVYADDENQGEVNATEPVTVEEEAAPEEEVVPEEEVMPEEEATLEEEAPAEEADDDMQAAAAAKMTITPGFSYTWISVDYADVAGAEDYVVEVNGEQKIPDENGKITGLTPGTSYTVKVTALGPGSTIVGEGTATITTKSAAAPAAPKVTAKGAVTSVTYSWPAVAGVTGYAYKRSAAVTTVASSAFRTGNVAKSTTLKGTTLTWFNLKSRASCKMSICAYKYVPSDEVANMKIVGTDIPVVLINYTNPKTFYAVVSKATPVTAKTTTKEKCTRTKQSKGYVYKYWDANGVYRGDSYGMWKAVKNKKSKTKYLIAIDRNRNNMVIYKKVKGVWTPYKHWLCACGMTKHKTPKGTHKIFKRKPKFNTGEKIEGGVKQTRFTCWYASRFKGACFIHSTIYMKGSKTRHAASKLGRNYSHGCVRLKIGNAKWVYNKCKNGTAVIVGDFTKDVSWGVLYSKKYARVN